MIQYRSFRNPDPPGLAELWNTSFTARGAAVLQSPLLLEYFVFSKPYFDPEGLVIALAEDKMVGFVHAGFGSDASGRTLDREEGVVCCLGVAPSHRRQGIGSELLHRAEAYLRERGATDLFAGPSRSYNPFSFGLYGGSSSPGFLETDTLARPFLEHHGYRPLESTQVFQRRLDKPLNVADARFADHRQRFEIHVAPYHGTWWEECVLGPVELHEFQLFDKQIQQPVARCLLWEMDTFSPAWQQYAVGLYNLEVTFERRRQGLGRFLLVQIMRHLQEQCFTLLEIQVEQNDAPTTALLRGLGFEVVDSGQRYQREGQSDQLEGQEGHG